MTQRNLLLAGSLAAVLACGSSVKEPAEVELTEANAPTLVSAVWLDNVATDSRDVLLEAEPLLARYLPLVAAQPNGATTDVACRASGAFTLVGQVADPRRPGWTVGDEVTATYAACREGTDPYAETRDGMVTLRITAIAVGAQTFTVTYEAFTTSVPGFGAFTSDGTATFTLAVEGDIVTVTGDAQHFTGSGGGMQETVDDKHVKLVDHGAAFDAPYSLEFSATATSSRWSGQKLRYETPVAFTGLGTGFPSQGQLLLHGANGASARMTALDAVSVRLELDLDGDGAVDPARSRTLTWVQIDDSDFGDAP